MRKTVDSMSHGNASKSNSQCNSRLNSCNSRPASGLSWNPLVPRRHKQLAVNASTVMCMTENRHVKTPFKQTRKPQLNPVMMTSQHHPSQNLQEKMLVATYEVAASLARKPVNVTERKKGVLVKGKLQPMCPVHVTGPAMDQCQGIVTDSRPRTRYMVNALATRRRVIVPQAQKEFTHQRPQTGESRHCTSVASDSSYENISDALHRRYSLDSDNDMNQNDLSTMLPSALSLTTRPICDDTACDVIACHYHQRTPTFITSDETIGSDVSRDRPHNGDSKHANRQSKFLEKNKRCKESEICRTNNSGDNSDDDSHSHDRTGQDRNQDVRNSIGRNSRYYNRLEENNVRNSNGAYDKDCKQNSQQQRQVVTATPGCPKNLLAKKSLERRLRSRSAGILRGRTESVVKNAHCRSTPTWRAQSERKERAASAGVVPSDTNKNNSTQDSCGKDTVQENNSTQDSCGKDTVQEKSSTQDSCRKDTVQEKSSTQDSCGNDTVQENNSTQDSCGKNTVQEKSSTQDSCGKDTVHEKNRKDGAPIGRACNLALESEFHNLDVSLMEIRQTIGRFISNEVSSYEGLLHDDDDVSILGETDETSENGDEQQCDDNNEEQAEISKEFTLAYKKQVLKYCDFIGVFSGNFPSCRSMPYTENIQSIQQSCGDGMHLMECVPKAIHGAAPAMEHMSNYEVQLVKNYHCCLSECNDESESKPFLQVLCEKLPPPEKVVKTSRDSTPICHSVQHLMTNATTKVQLNSRYTEPVEHTSSGHPPVCFPVNAQAPPQYFYYFAYGLDMNKNRFSTYIQREVKVQLWGLLFGFQLAFNKIVNGDNRSGLPNIQLNPYCSVEGCIYLVHTSELALVDSCMGYPQYFEHVMLPVWLLNCEQPDSLGIAQYCVAALLYVARDHCTHKEEVAADSFALDQCLKATSLLTPAYREHILQRYNTVN